MPQYFMVVTTDESHSAPDATTIESALQSMVFNGADGWVGPASRITRVPVPTALVPSTRTTVARLLQLSEVYSPSNVQTVLNGYATQLRGSLAGLTDRSTWSQPSAVPYDPALNGDLTWWQSGTAAATTTRDQARSLLGQAASTTENPVGPNTTTTTQSPPAAPNLPSVTDTTQLLKVGGIFLAGVVGLWFLWPLLSGARRVASSATSPRRQLPATARRNPVKRRRHR